MLATLTTFQRISRYLMTSVAAVWRLIGVSWSRLAVFGGLLFAITASLTYAIVSINLGSMWGLAATAPLLWSPLAFTVVPHFRDYAKACFILGMILVMALLVTGSGRPARVRWLATLGGLVLGIGLGFRNDLLITILPFLIVLLVLTPVHAARPWLVRISAVGAFLVTFAVAAAPVIADYSRGNNTPHVVLIGFMTWFDRPLGVERSVYDLGSSYEDSLVYGTVESFSERVQHRHVDRNTGAYDRAGFAYLRQLAMTTPADVLTRAMAATREVPIYVLREYLSPPVWVKSRTLRRLYYVRELIDVRLARLALFAVAAVVLIAAGQSIRLGVFLLLLLGVFAGGAAIQFHDRHFFYLEFVPWWAFASLCRGVLTTAATVKRGTWRLAVSHAAIVRSGVFGAVCLVTGVLVLLAAVAFQERQLRTLFDGYVAAPRHQLAIQPGHEPAVTTTFVVAELRGDRCPVDSVPVTMHGQWGRTVEARVGSREPTHVFFADYELSPGDEAPRVTVPPAAQSCLAEVSQVDTSAFPLLFNATLAPSWRSARLYQRLAAIW